MRQMIVLMSVLCLSALTARSGNVWYVDAACYDAETQDGSGAHPYGTIQRAIEAEAIPDSLEPLAKSCAFLRARM